MKKILVTGGAGFIGKHLVRFLHDQPAYELLNLDRLTYAGDPAWLEDLSASDRYQWECVDLCNAAAVQASVSQFSPDAILHLAAESHVDRSIDGPGDFIQTNVLGTFHLLQATRQHLATLDAERASHFRFVHVSTDEVYGALRPTDPAFTETHRYDPRSPYSATKAASDHLVRAWHHTYDLPAIVTNCSNNFGPGQYSEKLIPTVITRALAGEPIPVYGDGSNVRDWLHVSDHVAALHTVLEKGAVGETYNIGGNCERANLDLVRQICTMLDQLVPAAQSYAEQIAFIADRPGHDFRYAMNAAKIEANLGWRPQADFDQALMGTVKWYVENPNPTSTS